jgi:hypothetical protein
MRSSLRRKLQVACLLITAAELSALTARGGAQELGRPILRPDVINEPGVYTLFRSLSSQTTEPLITIRANNVTLNLNGHALRGPGNRTGIGILVENSAGVCVRNGVVTGFGTNVRVAGSNNVRVQDLKIIGNDLGGSPPDVETGIMIANSRAVLVQDNVISRTFLGVFVRGGGSGGNRIAGNTLAGGMNGMLGICYNPVPGSPAAPQGDLVHDNLISRFTVGIATSDETRNNVFKENVIAYFSMPVQEAVGGSNVFVDNTSTMMQP